MSAWIADLLNDMGYAGVAVLMFVENVFPPIPSELVMPLGGFLVAQGELSLPGVILAGTLGSVAGTLILFFVGRRFPQERLQRWIERRGQWFLITVDDVERAYRWFDRHGRAAVFFARVVPGVRSLISLPAGSSGMRLGPYLLYTTLGAGIWTTGLAYGGMLLGDQYQRLSRLLSQATLVGAVLLLLFVAWWVVQRLKESQRESQ